MAREHTYTIGAAWHGAGTTGTTSYEAFGREVTLTAPGKPPFDVSADVPFRGDGTKWNPEDLLVAALVQCHLYSYLYACTKAGVVVLDYRDEATGTMSETGDAGAFTEVILRPHVVVADPGMVDAALAAHDDAHRICFIAASVRFPVRHEPTIEVATR